MRPRAIGLDNTDDPSQDVWSPLQETWREGMLAYTGDALAHTIFASGTASADLWISATAADSDVQVTLTEVRTLACSYRLLFVAIGGDRRLVGGAG